MTNTQSVEKVITLAKQDYKKLSPKNIQAIIHDISYQTRNHIISLDIYIEVFFSRNNRNTANFSEYRDSIWKLIREELPYELQI